MIKKLSLFKKGDEVRILDIGEMSATHKRREKFVGEIGIIKKYRGQIGYGIHPDYHITDIKFYDSLLNENYNRDCKTFNGVKMELVDEYHGLIPM